MHVIDVVATVMEVMDIVIRFKNLIPVIDVTVMLMDILIGLKL